MWSSRWPDALAHVNQGRKTIGIWKARDYVDDSFFDRLASMVMAVSMTTPIGCWILKKKKRFSSSLSDYGTPFFIPLPWQRIDPVRIKKRRKRRKVLIEFDLVFLSLFSERTRRRAKAIHLGSISSGRVTHKAAPAQRSSWQCISPGHLTYSFHYLINPSSGSSNGGSGGSNRGPGIVNQLMGCWWRHRMLIISPLSSDVQEEDNGRVAKFRQI